MEFESELDVSLLKDNGKDVKSPWLASYRFGVPVVVSAAMLVVMVVIVVVLTTSNSSSDGAAATIDPQASCQDEDGNGSLSPQTQPTLTPASCSK